MFTKGRNRSVGFLYGHVLKPVFFALDPEDVHDFFVGTGKFLGRFSLTRAATRLWFDFSDKSLEQNILGIHFKNPVGLAAGFDKNAELAGVMPAVGFGFEEAGSVTGFPCTGNPRPRLWRLPKSRGLVVYYGLKNRGAEEISSRLQKKQASKTTGKKFQIPLGVSVAMTNRAENLDTAVAVADYVKAFGLFTEIADYITVNISCPNAQGGMPFLEPAKLDLLFSKLDLISTDKPIFVKMSPDKTSAEVDAVLDTLKKHRVRGIICSNLTKKSDNPNILEKNVPQVGGISGRPLQKISDDLISYIYKKEGKRFILVGCGGIFSAADAYKKIRAGASLVELITGMIFVGPQLISEINLGLTRLLRRDGFQNISEAVGADWK